MNKLLFLFESQSFLILFVFSFHPLSTIDAANEDFEENNSIMLCCTWGENLSDGKLTYIIEKKINSDHREAVVNAIKDWDNNLPLIDFVDISGSKKSAKKTIAQKF